MYVVIVFFEAKPDCVAQFRHAVVHNARMSLETEPGCRVFDVAQDPGNPAAFFLYEIYDDETAFKAHLETAHFKVFNTESQPWVAAKTVKTYALISNAGAA